MSKTLEPHRTGAMRSRLRCPRHRNLVDEPDAGGARRDRTDDLLLAKQALSQLSYGPLHPIAGAMGTPTRRHLRMVGLGRLELPTSRLSGVRSHRLSYRPPRPKPSKGRARSAGMAHSPLGGARPLGLVRKKGYVDGGVPPGSAEALRS